MYTLWSLSFIEKLCLFVLECNKSRVFALRLSYGHLRVLNQRFQFIAVPSRASALVVTFLWNITAIYSFQDNSISMFDFINRF